ncbi:hypothetical protein LTR97_003083 [Elasticomyces elasticus]|uniref:Uncharacterized protein n=1 Tax=Elasticomyces elasticus TaxID=574655 RepID=A0AAN7WDZ1_9PEZI|nr:hypothetical protein LTR97_003083 [Elasticomyces elasticus]
MSTVQPRALVVRWNRDHVCVRCPYCDAEHTHSTGEPLWTGQTRSSHCGVLDLQGQYTVLYPYESDATADGYGWELDKYDKMFRTVNRAGRVALKITEWPESRTSANGLDGLDNLARAVAGLSMNDFAVGQLMDSESPEPFLDPVRGAMWARLTSDEQSRKRLYFLLCKKNKAVALRRLFAEFTDGFANMTTDEGDNGVLLASSGKEPMPTIRLLQSRGIKLHHANVYGRTALMEAALWGQAQSVMYLTAVGADTRAQDGNGMTAIDLACGYERNRKERIQHRRVAGYQETAAACHQRLLVVHHLASLEQREKDALDAESFGNVSKFGVMHRMISSGHLALFKPTIPLKMPFIGCHQAFASLDRGPEYPQVHALSGHCNPGREGVLDNSVWTRKAVELCELIGHPKTESWASHAEKQIAAFLVDKHCLSNADEKTMGVDEVSRMVEVMPTSAEWVVHITISKAFMCTDCVDFFNRLSNWLAGKLTIKIITRTVGDSVVVLEKWRSWWSSREDGNMNGPGKAAISV